MNAIHAREYRIQEEIIKKENILEQRRRTTIQLLSGINKDDQEPLTNSKWSYSYNNRAWPITSTSQNVY